MDNVHCTILYIVHSAYCIHKYYKHCIHIAHSMIFLKSEHYKNEQCTRGTYIIHAGILYNVPCTLYTVNCTM